MLVSTIKAPHLVLALTFSFIRVLLPLDYRIPSGKYASRTTQLCRKSISFLILTGFFFLYFV